MVASFIGLQAQTDRKAADIVTLDNTAVELSWPRNVQARLDMLMLDPLLERSQLGLLIYDLTADSVLYSYGAKQALRPASTMKLLTAVTAIDQLGPQYLYCTSLRYTGEVKDSVLTGDLYCVGGMDPMFEQKDMNAFVQSVKALGINSIHGRIVAVTNFKEENLLGEGWCWDDDNPQLTPLLVDRKDEFMSRFVQGLRDAGIAVDGGCTTGAVPKDALTIGSCTHRLDEILEPMLKESDNLYAESMFFQIAASQGVRPAKAVHARQLIKKTLGKAGVSDIQYRIADGSGLSLYNYVTPELLTKLLIYAYRDQRIFMHLFTALPIAGQDGTLKKRMKEPFVSGKVRAKTGTLSGVSSLAGYVLTPNSHMLAFCIINQGIVKHSDGRGFQDRVCEALCK